MVSDQNQVKLGHSVLTMTVSNNSYDSKLPTGKPAKLTRKDYIIIATFAYVNIIIGCAYSCLAPFFPKEAESKGLTPSVYGFLISIQELVTFILSPIVGILLPKLGIRLIMLVGSIMGTIGVIFFGALVWAPYGTPFAVSCGLVRGFGSIGMAGIFACMFAAIPTFFPEHISQVFGLLEMCASVGMIIGPLAGGFLYEYGGFGLPFFVAGGLLALSFPLIFFICPEMKDSTKTENKAGILSILSNFRITVNIIVSLIVCVVFGFIQVSLEPHLRSFADLRSSTVGAIFLVVGLFYGVSTWLVGLVLPKIKDATFMSIIGLAFVIIAYLFIGPMYPIPIKPSVTLVVICQMFIGIGTSFCFVSTFTQGMREKDLTSLKDDPDVSGLMSSLFVSVFALGSGLGPIIGGQLVEHFSFQKSCIFIVGMSSATLLLILGTVIFHKRR
ncbi:MFS-type transporter SLC18B1 [Tetranychus urticae]|nr:MFS-type transporter SLC18B1 [Tetranychus urticae]